MTDIFSKADRSRIMSLVKSKHSKIEHNFAKFLRQSKIKFRRHVAKLPGKPDFLLPNKKTVIFVDSCFWHGCQYHCKLPQTNASFWKKKIARNKERDREINKIYKKMGWTAVRVWEHRLKKQDGRTAPGQSINFLNI